MKISKKKKSFQLKDSVPVTNNPFILNWLVEFQLNAYRNKTKNLSRNLFDELDSAFGEQTKRFMGDYLTSIWALCYGDMMFNVYTAMGKGTTIEVCDYTYEEINRGTKQEEIINFLSELGKVINT